ncbi:MAG TPA: hypothetical protein VLF91_02190 [Candidatus Saccharimonadales bacterium]|nr:hypothetical protein [Candidatus Saccharimonadales bacterium]
MYDAVTPKLGAISFFSENSFLPATEPVYDGDEWYIQGQFSVIDQRTEGYNKTKPFYKRRKGNKNGDLGHVFPFLICSAGYVAAHKKELAADGYKPIIMKKFSVQAATERIGQRIKEIGDNVTIDELWEQLSHFADTDYDDIS